MDHKKRQKAIAILKEVEEKEKAVITKRSVVADAYIQSSKRLEKHGVDDDLAWSLEKGPRVETSNRRNVY